jgi:hypothetical protein
VPLFAEVALHERHVSLVKQQPKGLLLYLGGGGALVPSHRLNALGVEVGSSGGGWRLVGIANVPNVMREIWLLRGDESEDK